MPTPRILRCDFWLRDYWDEDEARAMLHLDSKTEDNEKYWKMIKEMVSPYVGGYKKKELYDAMERLGSIKHKQK